MKRNKKFARAAQTRRLKAVAFTLLFHTALFAAVVYGTDVDFKKLLPDTVKDWIEPAADNTGKEDVAYQP